MQFLIDIYINSFFCQNIHWFINYKDNLEFQQKKTIALSREKTFYKQLLYW